MTSSRLPSIVGVLAAALSAFASVTLVASPTVAAPVPKGTWHEEEDFVVDWCDSGASYAVHHAFDASFLETRHGEAKVFYDMGLWHSVMTVTDPATGRWFEVDNDGVNAKDLHVTDNGDGTVTVDVLSTSYTTVFDSTGRRVSQGDGLETYSVLFDSAGTPTDRDDDVVLGIFGDTFRGNAAYLEMGGICGIAAVLFG